MLLSAGKQACASSWTEGHEPAHAAEENVRTWWQAASAGPDEWLQLDLGSVYDVHAVQINFADDAIDIPCPGPIVGTTQARYIEERDLTTRWKLSASPDGENWFVIEDKTCAQTDLSHDLIVREDGFAARYLRLTDMSVPYGQSPCISGLRVFGLGHGARPAAPAFAAKRCGDLDMDVTIRKQADALGYNILFGLSPDKLYHSCMVFAPGTRRIGALVKGQQYFVRVDAFNESGITEGTCVPLEEAL